MLPVAFRAMSAQAMPKPEISGPAQWTDITIGRVMREKVQASLLALFLAVMHPTGLQLAQTLAVICLDHDGVPISRPLRCYHVGSVTMPRSYILRSSKNVQAESGAPTSALFTVKTHDSVFKAIQKVFDLSDDSSQLSPALCMDLIVPFHFLRPCRCNYYCAWTPRILFEHGIL
jgi:hypothetical protein